MGSHTQIIKRSFLPTLISLAKEHGMAPEEDLGVFEKAVDREKQAKLWAKLEKSLMSGGGAKLPGLP